MLWELFEHDTAAKKLKELLTIISTRFEASLKSIALPILSHDSPSEFATKALSAQWLLVMKWLGNLFAFVRVLSPRMIRLLAWNAVLLKCKDAMIHCLSHANGAYVVHPMH